MEEKYTVATKDNNRMNRVNYLIKMLASIIIVWTINIALIFSLMSLFVVESQEAIVIFMIFFIVVIIVLEVYQIMITAKRCHDFDVSGWWASLLIIMPFIWVIFGFIPGTEAPNKYGDQPK